MLPTLTPRMLTAVYTMAVTAAYLVVFGESTRLAVEIAFDPSASPTLTRDTPAEVWAAELGAAARTLFALLLVFAGYCCLRLQGTSFATRHRGPGAQVSWAAGLTTIAVTISFAFLAPDLPGSRSFPWAQGETVGTVLLVAVNAAVAEEVIVVLALVRGCELLRVPTWLMYLVAVAARLAYHVYYGTDVLWLIPWAVATVWLYHRHRMIWPQIVLHFVWNAAVGLTVVGDWPGTGSLWRFTLISVGLFWLLVLLRLPSGPLRTYLRGPGPPPHLGIGVASAERGQGGNQA
jgi:hypothetical protein